MKKYRRTVQVVILSAIFIIGAFTLASSLFSKTPIPKVGSAAPEFTLPGMNGGETSLVSFRGQPVVLNFWGTYCPPCVSEMPLIQRYYDHYKDDGLIVLGINENDPLVTAKAFVRQYELTFPILMDKDVVRKQYGITFYPVTVFISPEGIIQEIKVGEMDEAYLKRTLAALMGK